MAKVSVKKAKKKTRPAAKAKKSTAKKAKKPPGRRRKQLRRSRQAPAGDKLSFNHAMVYVKDVQRALDFYRELLGFKQVDEFRYEGRPVYARLRAPGGEGTIALHQAGPGASRGQRGRALVLRNS